MTNPVLQVVHKKWDGDLTITGNFTVNGNFTFGNAATDSLTVTGTYSQTYAGTNDGHLVSGSGNLTAGKDLARFSSTGSLSSTSNVVAIEQATGAGSAGAYALYISATGTNVEALKVDDGNVVFDEALTVTGASALNGGITMGAVTTGINMTGAVTTGLLIAGNATDGVKISGGTVTDAIEIGAATNGIHIAGNVTTGILIAGTQTDAIRINGAGTNLLAFDAVEGCISGTPGTLTATHKIAITIDGVGTRYIHAGTVA